MGWASSVSLQSTSTLRLARAQGYTAWDMSEILTTVMLKDLDLLYNPE